VDVILSNKSGFCHGVGFDASKTVHVCYCLAPTRYVWQLDAYIAREGLGKVAQMGLRPLIAMMKRWDYNAAQKVTHFIAISTEIQERIQRYYERDSVVIYPPVDTERFKPVAQDEVEDYFLVVSRLIPYKRIDLAIEAANRLGVKLKIGGRGRDIERLQSLAGENVEFLGFVPDEELPHLMAKAKAFVFPGLEDFGITPVQSQAAGRPVIAFKGGGALDTVLAGKSGEHFAEQTVESLVEVMRDFDAQKYDPVWMRQHALKFDTQVFNQQIDAFMAQALEAHRQQESFVWQDPLA
jgi:glycosyltransferase involved in cell wall biosynthesis